MPTIRSIATGCCFAMLVTGMLLACGGTLAEADEPAMLPKATIDGTGPGCELAESDFTNVNCEPGTWTWKDGTAHCTGQPVGVIRTVKEYGNFELVAQWRHLKSAGNSGIFVWTIPESLKDLKPGRLPHGIEVQVLDHGYTEQYEKQTKKKADWFTTNGDVFPVGAMKLTPFPPLSPDGSRSFPRKQLSKGINEWNHYYVGRDQWRSAPMGQRRGSLGGHGRYPRSGYLCLESEGSPVEFRNLRIRELP